MKKVSVLLVALLGSVALNSHAAGFFVGGEAGVAVYPDFTSSVAQSMVKAGFASASVKQDRGSTAFGIYGGQWVTDNFGWEAAYTDLGSIDGKVTTVPASNTTYRYAAGALSATALGGIKLHARGTLYGKAGLYRASVKFDSVTRSVTTSSTGLVLGGGYSMSFTNHLIGKAELAIYNGVKFQTFNASNGTNTSDNITKVSVGVAYAF